MVLLIGTAHVKLHTGGSLLNRQSGIFVHQGHEFFPVFRPHPDRHGCDKHPNCIPCFWSKTVASDLEIYVYIKKPQPITKYPPMPVTPTHRSKSNTQTALEELRKLIFSGELSADSNHLESELADRLGMSRTPVREATLMLAAQGLLEVRPRKGVRIKAISATDMHEIYEILTELECLSVVRAANAGYTQSDLTALNASIERIVTAFGNEDREGWAAADEAFHSELVELGGNSRVRSIVQNFNDQVRRARALTLYMRPLPTKSNDDHRQVYEAILAGDADRARQIHENHRLSARKLLTNLLEQKGLRRI